MFAVRYIFYVLIFIGSSGVQSNANSDNYAKVHKITQLRSFIDIKRIATLNNSEIDIGWIALLMAKEIDSTIDITKYDKIINIMVSEVSIKAKNITDPDTRIRIMNTYFLKVLGYSYDHTDTFVQNKSNKTISGLIDTRKGSCWTMPLLYLAVSQRLGYPVYPVSAPAHIFLRYESSRLLNKNIEATSAGNPTDEEMIYVLDIPEKGIRNGVYMKTMTYREYVGEMIATNGVHWAQMGDLSKSAKYIELALTLEPKAAELYRILGNLYYSMSDTTNDKVKRTRLQQIAKLNMKKANHLGVASPLHTNYEQTQKARQHKLMKGKHNK